MRQFPANDAEWAHEYERRYLYSCYLYYHGPADVEPPLDDVAFDNLQVVLSQHWYDKTTPEFRARVARDTMKTDAHSLQFTEDEKRAAVDWATRRADDSLALALTN